jgi:hypothetical protein
MLSIVTHHAAAVLVGVRHRVPIAQVPIVLACSTRGLCRGRLWLTIRVARRAAGHPPRDVIVQLGSIRYSLSAGSRKRFWVPLTPAAWNRLLRASGHALRVRAWGWNMYEGRLTDSDVTVTVRRAPALRADRRQGVAWRPRRVAL